MHLRTRTLVSTATAATTALLASAGPASALESPVTPDQYVQNAAAGHQQLGLVGSPKGSVMVIGDSLSSGTTYLPDTSAEVPYASTFAAAGYNVRVRAKPGATVNWHLLSQGWNAQSWATADANVPSFDLAANSSVKAVFVNLGTNDALCLRPAQNANLCWGGRTGTPPSPSADPAGYAKFAKEEKDKIIAAVNAARTKLLAKGKCVVWSGPREVTVPGTDAADFAWFNSLLRGQAALNPGKVFFADWNQAIANIPALTNDYATGDAIHMETPAARAAMAQYALSNVLGNCFKK